MTLDNETEHWHPAKDIFLAEIIIVSTSATDASGTFTPHGWREMEQRPDARGFRRKIGGRSGTQSVQPAFSASGDVFAVGDLVYMRERGWSNVSGVNGDTFEILCKAGDNAAGSDGNACTPVVTGLGPCVNGQQTYTVKYMRGSFTVSDTPCIGGMGQGGMGVGGMGGGGGGGVPPPLPLPGPGGIPPPPLPGPGPGPGPVGGGGGGQTRHECIEQCTQMCLDAFGYADPGCIAACFQYCGGDPGPLPTTPNRGGTIWPSGTTGGVGGMGLVGKPMGGGRAMGGSTVLDPFPTGVSGQVLGYDANGDLTATTVSTQAMNTVTPADLTVDVDNYAPGTGKNFRLSTDDLGAVNITGLSISQVDGQEIIIQNVGTIDNIVLKVENASSSAANRFNNADSTSIADITIAPNTGKRFFYDGGASRWRNL